VKMVPSLLIEQKVFKCRIIAFRMGIKKRFRVVIFRSGMYPRPNLSVSQRLPLCLSCFRFAFYEHFCTFFDSFDETTFILTDNLGFKENLKNLVPSTNEIRQKAQCEKNQNPEDRHHDGLGRCLILIITNIHLASYGKSLLIICLYNVSFG